jgi:outer membrane biosynthesis protein TonB
MKRSTISSIAAAAALGFAGLACAQTSPGTATDPSASQPYPSEQSLPAQQPAAQPMPSEQPTPAPSTPATPSAGQGTANQPDESGADQQTTPAPGRSSMSPSTEQSSPGQANQSVPDRSGQATGESSSSASTTNTRLAAVVPSGMSTQEACTGFSSVAECATALHLAQNLNVPFTDLKAKVSGGQQLGAVVHELKPDADAQAEVSKATEQARIDMGVPQG